MRLLSFVARLSKPGVIAVCLLFGNGTLAQEALSLEKSIELAKQHNLTLRQARHNAAKASINLRKSQFSYLPTLTAQADVRRVNGLTFDNVSGELKRGSTTTSNPYIVAQLVLFDGFSKLFELKKAQQLATAGKYLQTQSEIDMEARITGYYLQALLDHKNIHLANERIALLEQQLHKTEKLAEAGLQTQEDIYLLKSQLSNEKLNLINHQNNYRQAYTALAQEINTDQNDFQLIFPQAPIPIYTDLPPMKAILAKALANSPQLKAAEAQVQAARYSYKITRNNISPTIALRGIMGSNYSSNYRAVHPIDGTFTQVAYFDQLDQNKQKILELSINIPVFGGLSRHFEAQETRMDLQNSEMDYKATQNSLTQSIQQAYQDVLAAQEKYRTVIANMEYSEKAYAAAAKRYETGKTDFYVYLETLNNKNRAQTELLQSKCEFYFKLRILELYQG